MSKKQKKSKNAETVQEQVVAVAEKTEEPKEEKIPKLHCQNCAYRNNNENDRRAGKQGGSGWCSRRNKYVARKNWACEDVKERKRKHNAKIVETEEAAAPEEKAPERNAICKLCKCCTHQDGEAGTGFCEEKGSYITRNQLIVCDTFDLISTMTKDRYNEAIVKFLKKEKERAELEKLEEAVSSLRRDEYVARKKMEESNAS